MVILKDVETEDGDTTDLTVAMYVYYDLNEDNLSFSLPVYNQMLEEAVEQSMNDDFKAETYFTQHSDINISKVATEMIIDRFNLGKSAEEAQETAGMSDLKRQKLHDEKVKTILEQVVHMLADYRMDYVEQRIVELRKEISLAGSDMERVMKLMTELKEKQQYRNELAKKLGSQILN